MNNMSIDELIAYAERYGVGFLINDGFIVGLDISND